MRIEYYRFEVRPMFGQEEVKYLEIEAQINGHRYAGTHPLDGGPQPWQTELDWYAEQATAYLRHELARLAKEPSPK